jgi:hypothetical protein
VIQDDAGQAVCVVTDGYGQSFSQVRIPQVADAFSAHFSIPIVRGGR